MFFHFEKERLVLFLKKAALTACALLALSAPAFASVGKGHDEKINYKMDYPIVYVEDKAVQDAINQDIYRYLAAFRAAYEAGSFRSGNLSYEVKYEDADFVSLILTDYRYIGGNHGMPDFIGLTYYKKTGQPLTLPFFAKIRPTDAARVYELPVWSSRDGGARLSEKNLNPGYRSEPLSGNYFLMGNGKIALIYQPYQLASYAEGMTYIVLEPEFVDYLNRKNS